MELELKKAAFDCYEASPDVVVTQEESAENIVPDYCPDIARIIDTAGAVYVHSRDLRDGRAEVTGAVQVTVLYIPDGESGIRTLEFALPFTAQGEGKGDRLYAETALETIETRLVNPRKVSTRCRLLTRLTASQRVQTVCCGDVENAGTSLGIEKRQEVRQATAVTQILEKDFTFADTLHISPGKPTAEELLLKKVRSTVTEAKIIGSKLIMKGVFTVELLCRGEGNQYYVTAGELPFSQILEAEDTAESAVCQTMLQLTGADFQLGGDGGEDGHEVSVTLYLHAWATLREDQELLLLTDLYSTVYDLEYEAAPVSFSDFAQSILRRQSAREVMEIGVVAKSILSMDVSCGTVSVTREKEQVTLRTAASLRAMYLDEGDVPLVSERRVEVSTQLELPEECQVIVRADCPEEVQGSLTAGGIEARFSVDFAIEAVSCRKIPSIVSAKLDAEKPKDMTGQPSIVLRYLDKSESLWNLAKRYSTTGAEILAANELEAETDIPRDQLLLIPRKRM